MTSVYRIISYNVWIDKDLVSHEHCADFMKRVLSKYASQAVVPTHSLFSEGVYIMQGKTKQSVNPGRIDSHSKLSLDDTDLIGGRGWHGNSEGHAAAGKKGGETVAKDKEHMAEIGRRGGKSRSPQTTNSVSK